MQITENKDVHGCQFQPDPSMEKLQSRVDRIKHKLIVLSGKGGVGKSTVSVNTALALANAGNKVGLLDIDIHGPSIPGILGLIGQTVEPSDTGLTPVSYSENLKVMSVGFLLPRQDDAVIWRGPLKNSVIKQFLSDVEWGDLDYLIVDAPPGTGDEPLSIAQLMPQGTHGIIVTTPQRVAVTDVRKSVTFCHKLGLKILGVIENMSGFNCPHCGESVNVFSQGGGESMASDFKIPFLGAIPLDPQIMMCGDRADSFLELHSESSAAAAYRKILKQFPGCDGAIESKNVAHLTDDMIRFAIPIAQKRLCMHFGHCEEFYFVDADKKSGALINQFFKTPPPHEPGILPGWINECGANYVIAGGMGSRARQLFEQVGVQVVTGASAEDPEIIVKQYLNGTLTTGDNVCDH